MNGQTECVLALGSNLGDSPSLLSEALVDIADLRDSSLHTVSRWYGSTPLGGPEGQPDYINGAVLITTALTPEILLKQLHAIELRYGRERSVRNAARTLDIDIIDYAGVKTASETLTLPHPRAHQRAFVLLPLRDVKEQVILKGQSLDFWLGKLSHADLAQCRVRSSLFQA